MFFCQCFLFDGVKPIYNEVASIYNGVTTISDGVASIYNGVTTFPNEVASIYNGFAPFRWVYTLRYVMTPFQGYAI